MLYVNPRRCDQRQHVGLLNVLILCSARNISFVNGGASPFSKLVHDILPTAAQQNKMDNGTRKCPTCLHTPENRDYIIRCPHCARNKWRHTLLTALHESCVTLFTYASHCELLEDTIREWMYADILPGQDLIVHDDHYPTELRIILIRQQNNIGWRQQFHGRLSVEWSSLQSNFYHRTRDKRPGQNHKFTGDGWQVSIITLLWKHWRILWKQRNQDVHGRDTASHTIAEQTDVKEQHLEQIYHLVKRHMEPSAQSL